MPARRYVTEVVRLMRGVALDKPVNIRAQGFMPASSGVLEMSRRDGLLAGCVPYCLGAETVTAFTYELMHTIPGFSDGFDEATRLVPHFERTEPWAFARRCPVYD